MYFSIFRSICLFGSLAAAFKDASPLIAFSTSRSLNLTDSNRLVTLISSAAKLQQRLESSVSACSTDQHYLVTIPGVSDMDLSSSDAMYALRQIIATSRETIGSSSIVDNVVGKIDLDQLQSHISSSCDAHGRTGAVIYHDCSSMSKEAISAAGYVEADKIGKWRFCTSKSVSNSHTASSNQIYRIDLPALPESDDRANILANYDHALAELIGSSQSFTIIITTTPPNPNYHWRQHGASSEYAEGTYHIEESFSSDSNMELKRDFSAHKRDEQDSRPLFEKYNFLSPGLFMGLFTTIILVLILYIALTALSSMQVSYMSFSKEMGPAAQRKQQQ